MRRTLTLSLLLAILSLPALAQETASSALKTGTPIERTIGLRQVHVFEVSVEEPSYIRVVVEQHGVDVVIRVSDPKSNSLGEFDSPTGQEGAENVSVIAPAPGSYKFTVSPLDQDITPQQGGRYVIKLEEVRTATNDELESSLYSEARKLKASKILQDLEAAIPQVRPGENRIRLQLQLAKLLFTKDEKRGLKVLDDATNELRELLMSLSPLSSDGGEDAMALIMKGKQLRIEFLQLLVERDPELALNFMRSTRALVPVDHDRRSSQDQERDIEVYLANRFSISNPKRALELAEENLKTGISMSLLQTVFALRNRAPELAPKLTKQIVDKLMTEKLLRNESTVRVAMGLLGDRGGNPLLEQADHKALLRRLVSEVTSFNAGDINSRDRNTVWALLHGLKPFFAEIENISPGAASTVEKKLAALTASMDPLTGEILRFQDSMNNAPSMVAAIESVAKAPQEIRDSLSLQLAERIAASGDMTRARQVLNDNISNPYQRQQALNNLERNALSRAIGKGNFDEALRSIIALKPSRDRTSQIAQMAGHIGGNLKRASALNLLEQLRSLLGPSLQAEDQDTMSALFDLSRAFSHYDSGRAFEMFEPLVDQFNDLSMAARTLNGFGQRYYLNNELMLQDGNTIGNLATQMASTMGTLALRDFDRARDSADKIRLPEVKVIAYLQIAQQVMGVK